MSTLRIQLDTGRCLAYGNCVTIMPDAFDLPAGSPVAVLLREHVGDDEREDLEETVRACPARAIAFTEEPGTDSGEPTGQG